MLATPRAFTPRKSLADVDKRQYTMLSVTEQRSFFATIKLSIVFLDPLHFRRAMQANFYQKQHGYIKTYSNLLIYRPRKINIT